uniref:HNH endonuclease n=1 Tax=Candidatus Kentrum sp. SD TaxID=2126332 RepID=A0A450YL44_9GAMM|nr:MAG: hypothetical protein BECKSD772F_GA0070984_111810 [Candidatus Kentron sp. SD]VFK48163.1 MAG: hypothetical protein BECKSD772E_GA0070983_11157 [Candidatus Kentron sp. SD]VFK77679.1 MAG: hypothetical protein BECKSD772D_GA0070982_10018 [Candidatus Kentron sp. SD]
MGFSREIKERILVNTARHCCVCHRYKGVKVEVHHIEHKSERFAFGYVLYWLALRAWLQTGCSLRGRRVFQNLYFSDT